MSGNERTCPGCGSAATRKDGRDRKGQQRFRCGICRCRFTALTGTPFSGYRFPPDVIALAVRWYLRFRLSYADVAELLAERGVGVDPSTVFAWVREFAPLYEAAARPFRRAVGGSWSVDETYGKGFSCVVRWCGTLTVWWWLTVGSTMAGSEQTCPGCGSAATRKDGRDRREQQRFRCGACGRRFTTLTGTPFAGYRFPPDIIALAVRWYLRYRLSYADVAELLAERGVAVDPSTVYAWVREFAPLYEDAARPVRRAIGSSWSVDETYAKIAGKPAYVYRAIDGQGQVVDVYVSTRRATADAIAFFRRAVASTGVVPDEVTTDGAAAYPPALAAAPPPVAHETGKAVQQRIERDHQHLKGRLRPMRGFKTLAGARMFCRAHAFLRNLRAQCYDLAHLAAAMAVPAHPPMVQAWDALTATLLGR